MKGGNHDYNALKKECLFLSFDLFNFFFSFIYLFVRWGIRGGIAMDMVNKMLSAGNYH